MLIFYLSDFRFGSVSISLSDLLNGKWCSILMFQQQPSTKHSPSLILCAKYLIFGMSMIKSVLWQTPKESNLPRRLRVSKLKLLIAEQWKENTEFAMWPEDQLKCKVRKKDCQINFDNIKNLSNCSSHLTIFSTQF